MPQQRRQEKGTGAIAFGGATTAYGAAHAPVLRAGYKDKSKMGSASPKAQASRYQGELHNAMKAGNVTMDSPVHVFRTPSGRHVNAGGTHRQVAREAMGRPSQYEVKPLSHEIHISPAAKLKGKMQVAALKRGSKRAEAGLPIKPVDPGARKLNRAKAAAADIADTHIWSHPSMLGRQAAMGRKAGLISAGVVAGAGALTTAAGLHQRHEWNKTHGVSKMSDTELRHRRKVQGNIGRTTSTLGLTGLGITGAAALAARKPGALKAVQKLPKLKNATPEKMRNAAINTGIVSGGIGGVGGFNQASIYSAESKRRKATVTKSMGIEAPFFGEEGQPVEISKDWSANGSKFDPEAKRHRRNELTEAGLGGGAAGLAGGGAYRLARAGKIVSTNYKKGQRKAKRLPNVAAAQAGRRAEAMGHVKVAGKAGLGAAGLAGAAALVHHQRKGSWTSYGKRDSVSAFGVDHLNPNGQPSETEN